MSDKLRRILALLLCLGLVLVGLVGCSSDVPEEPDYDEDEFEDTTELAGREDELIGTWIREDGEAMVSLDGEGGFGYDWEGLSGVGSYTYDGEILNFTICNEDGEDESGVGFVEEDGSLLLDDLGGIFLPEGTDAALSNEALLDTWVWYDENGMGNFTFTEEYVEMSYSILGDLGPDDVSGGAGTNAYTLTEDGVILDSLEIAAFGDAVFTFTDENTLTASNGTTLIRESVWLAMQDEAEHGQEASREEELHGMWMYSEQDGAYLYFDGVNSMEVGTVDNGVEDTLSYSFDGETLIIYDVENIRGHLDADGDLILEGMDGWFEKAQEEGAPHLDGTCWDNDGLEMSLHFADGSFTVGHEDRSISGIYTFDGENISLVAENGETEYGYIDADGDIIMENAEGYFQKVDSCSYITIQG